MDALVKTQDLKRLCIAEGHIKKVKRMVQEDSYCPDIIHQSQAVQAALRKIDQVVLKGHLNCCVLNEMKGNRKSKSKLIGEIVDLFNKNGKQV